MQSQSVFGKPGNNKVKKASVKVPGDFIADTGVYVQAQQNPYSVDPQEDKKLFERLRLLRLQIAQEENLRAYMVLSDRTLHELATHKPTSLSFLRQIYGIGKNKKDRFGEKFVNSICDYLGVTDAPQPNIVSEPAQFYMPKHS